MICLVWKIETEKPFHSCFTKDFWLFIRVVQLFRGSWLVCSISGRLFLFPRISLTGRSFTSAPSSKSEQFVFIEIESVEIEYIGPRMAKLASDLLHKDTVVLDFVLVKDNFFCPKLVLKLLELKFWHILEFKSLNVCRISHRLDLKFLSLVVF